MTKFTFVSELTRTGLRKVTTQLLLLRLHPRSLIWFRVRVRALVASSTLSFQPFTTSFVLCTARRRGERILATHGILTRHVRREAPERIRREGICIHWCLIGWMRIRRKGICIHWIGWMSEFTSRTVFTLALKKVTANVFVSGRIGERIVRIGERIGRIVLIRGDMLEFTSISEFTRSCRCKVFAHPLWHRNDVTDLSANGKRNSQQLFEKKK